MPEGNILTNGVGAEDPGFLMTGGYGDFWGWSSVPAIPDAGRLLTHGFGSQGTGNLLTGGYGEFDTHAILGADRLVVHSLGASSAYQLTGGYGDFAGVGNAPGGGSAISRIRGLHLLDRFRWWR